MVFSASSLMTIGRNSGAVDRVRCILGKWRMPGGGAPHRVGTGRSYGYDRRRDSRVLLCLCLEIARAIIRPSKQMGSEVRPTAAVD